MPMVRLNGASIALSARLSGVLLIGLLTLLASIAQPVYWEGNGHYYEIVLSSNIAWNNARIQAEQRTYQCRRGYLATITSQAEQDFIWNLLRANHSCGSVSSQFYLGGYEDPAGTGNWYWVTGEPMAFTYWQPGEPNNRGYETVIALGLYCSGHWNNVPPSGSWGARGYIVEYGEASTGGDVDQNGCVDDADLLAVLFAFGQSGSSLPEDVNCDGTVDDADLLTVLFNFGSGC
ncbi:MAG: lectin-like protein [Fimbriimonadales bacterium]